MLGGFPRLFYGFSAGMLIYVWRFTTTPRQLENMKVSVNPWILYAVLITMLIFPSYVQGVYSLFAVATFAPMLVWFGSFVHMPKPIHNDNLEFLGWLSFPLYCLHKPVFDAMEALNVNINFSEMHGISPQLVAIPTTLILSIVTATVFDRVRLQHKLTYLFKQKIVLPVEMKPARNPPQGPRKAQECFSVSKAFSHWLANPEGVRRNGLGSDPAHPELLVNSSLLRASTAAEGSHRHCGHLLAVFRRAACVNGHP